MSRSGSLIRSQVDGCAKLGAARRQEPRMTKYLLTIDYNGGGVDSPMEEGTPDEIKARTARRRG
jgi:hypothetical protein